MKGFHDRFPKDMLDAWELEISKPGSENFNVLQ